MIFDRTNNHDLRSFDYVLGGAETLPIVDRMWDPGLPVLDQGQLGACTGFAAATVCATMPGLSATNRRRLARNQMALSLYVLITAIDSTPGAYPQQDTGSDVNSALKAMRDLGWVGLYQWLPNARSVAGAVSHVGPVDMGTVWFSSMMDTKPVDGHAVVVVDEHSGGENQGHSWSIVGIEAASPYPIIGKNSWGPNWGAGGYFRMSLDDLDKLIAAQGDAVVVQVEKSFDAAAGLV